MVEPDGERREGDIQPYVVSLCMLVVTVVTLPFTFRTPKIVRLCSAGSPFHPSPMGERKSFSFALGNHYRHAYA